MWGAKAASKGRIATPGCELHCGRWRCAHNSDMEYRALGSTGLCISPISFGAGPVSQLLVGDRYEVQRATILSALDAGINWFDTAATYGDGQSETNLGRTLADLSEGRQTHVATKVRLTTNDLTQIGSSVRNSLAASLRRLRLECVTLLQIHNSITAEAGSQPTSITPAHVLAPGGVLETLQCLQREGLVQHLGLTGLGEYAALAEVIDSGAFATIQIPYNLLNPSAGQDVSSDFSEANYGNLITRCGQRGMGVFAIRVLAGGALAGQPPSPHTRKTPFFPLDLYQRDCRLAEQLESVLPADLRREEAAVRFALSHPHVTSAIVGLASSEQVAEAVRFADAGPLDKGLLTRLMGSPPPTWDES
jgi:aryl-alcohol dehydrogenase-like predicted oxidoreductase